LLKAEYSNILSVATLERDRLTLRKTSVEDSLRRLQQAYIAEADGMGGSMQRGIENLTRLKLDAYNAALTMSRPELANLATQISSQDSILANAKANMETKRKEYESAVIANVGFLERNKALSDLSEEESSVFWANLFISLLIIVIEIGPVLSKLIMNVGPYDLALAKTELTQMATAENEMRRD